jgi:hypothetical protein
MYPLKGGRKNMQTSKIVSNALIRISRNTLESHAIQQVLT